MRRLHMIIHGRVQGVFFRASTEEKARALGLTGWVSNLRDGTVEVMAEGSEEKLRALLHWCHQGPDHAHVAKVDEEWGEATGTWNNFRTEYSSW